MAAKNKNTSQQKKSTEGLMEQKNPSLLFKRWMVLVILRKGVLKPGGYQKVSRVTCSVFPMTEVETQSKASNEMQDANVESDLSGTQDPCQVVLILLGLMSQKLHLKR